MLAIVAAVIFCLFAMVLVRPSKVGDFYIFIHIHTTSLNVVRFKYSNKEQIQRKWTNEQAKIRTEKCGKKRGGKIDRKRFSNPSSLTLAVRRISIIYWSIFISRLILICFLYSSLVAGRTEWADEAVTTETELLWKRILFIWGIKELYERLRC